MKKPAIVVDWFFSGIWAWRRWRTCSGVMKTSAWSWEHDPEMENTMLTSRDEELGYDEVDSRRGWEEDKGGSNLVLLVGEEHSQDNVAARSHCHDCRSQRSTNRSKRSRNEEIRSLLAVTVEPWIIELRDVSEKKMTLWRLWLSNRFMYDKRKKHVDYNFMTCMNKLNGRKDLWRMMLWFLNL